MFCAGLVILSRENQRRAINWGWRWVAASATAACLVLLLAFITLRFLRQPTVNAPSEPLVAQQHQPDTSPFGAKFAGNTPRSSATFRSETPLSRAGRTGDTKWRSESVADSRASS